MNYLHERIIDTYYPVTNKKPRLRDAVRGICVTDDDEVLLLHILTTDLFGPRDHYELPGGGIEENEDEEMTMHREMLEEVGYEITDVKPIGMIEIEYHPLERIDCQHYYLCKAKKFVGQQLLAYEKEIFKEVVKVKVKDLLKFYEEHQAITVGKMIHERDLIALKAALNLDK